MAATSVVRSTFLLLAIVLAAIPGERPVAAVASAGQPAATEPPAPLALPSPGDSMLRRLASNGVDVWQVDLPADTYVEIAVEPADGDFEVRVDGPDGLPRFTQGAAAALNAGLGDFAVIVAALVADRAGPYRLVVRNTSPASWPAGYRLSLDRLRPREESDTRRLEAYGGWAVARARAAEGTQAARAAAAERLATIRAALAALGDPEGEARTLVAIADTWYRRGNAGKGREAMSAARVLWDAAGRPREAARAESDLGLLAYVANDREAAQRHYDAALEQHRAVQDLLGEAMTITRIGWLQYAASRPHEAVETATLALDLWTRAGSISSTAVSLNDLGRAYTDLGEISRALEALQRALPLRPPDRDPRGAANVLNRLGNLYIDAAEWQRALDTLQEGLELARQGHDDRAEIALLANLSMLYVRLGDAAEVRRHLEPALVLSQNIGFRLAEANLLVYRAIHSLQNGDIAASRADARQALAIHEAIADTRGLAMSRRVLAHAALAAGQPAEARDWLASIPAEGVGTGGMVYLNLLPLAEIHAALGEDAQARQTYEQAIARYAALRADGARAGALERYGRYLARQGALADARARMREGLELRESQRTRVVDPDLRVRFTAATLEPYGAYLDLLMQMHRQDPDAGHAREAFLVHERSRARGLLDLLAEAGVDIRRGVDPALVGEERRQRRDLDAKAAALTATLVRSPESPLASRLAREVDDLRGQLRLTTTRIRQASPEYAALVDARPLSADEVAPLLGDDTVLLAYGLGQEQAYVWAVAPGTFMAVPLGPTRAIDRAARALAAALARGGTSAAASRRAAAGVDTPETEVAAAAADLGRLLLEPLAGELTGAWRGRRLAIVAPGALEYVPFGAVTLPASVAQGPSPGTSGEPLAVTHELVMLPSASALPWLRRQQERQPRPAGTVALLADPVFSSDDPRLRRRSGPAATRTATRTPGRSAGETLARLVFSRREAQAVAALAPPSSRLQALDFDASLPLVTSGRLADFRIVHFATHGLIDTANPRLSGLALSMVDAAGTPRDGLLRLDTIFNLSLNADLVVLSACRTALGEDIRGEGLVGLTRAFMYAGAPTVVASLWQVDDVATAELMARFYRAMLRDGLAAAAALRRAQLELRSIRRFAAPYYWAGFVVQGDWR